MVEGKKKIKTRYKKTIREVKGINGNESNQISGMEETGRKRKKKLYGNTGKCNSKEKGKERCKKRMEDHVASKNRGK